MTVAVCAGGFLSHCRGKATEQAFSPSLQQACLIERTFASELYIGWSRIVAADCSVFSD